MVRRPPGPSATSSASSARATAARSPAGSAWRERTAERAAVAHGGVGDGRGRHGQQRGVLLHERVVDHVAVLGHRADDERVALVGDAAQLGHPREVDEHGREGQPQPQDGDEALPTGEDLGVLTGLAEGADGLSERRRGDVVEVGGDHSACPSSAA
jgi:hypothetical protein